MIFPSFENRNSALFASVLLACCVSCSPQPDAHLEADSESSSTTHAPIADEQQPAADPEETVSTSSEIPTLTTIKENNFDAAIRDIVVREDPIVDGWDTEYISEIVTKQLKEFGDLMTGKSDWEQHPVIKTVASDYRSSDLRPGNLNTVFESKSILVRRSNEPELRLTHRGHEGFREAIEQVRNQIQTRDRKRFKFKVIRVSKIPGGAITRSYFEISGRQPPSHTASEAASANESLQINSTWTCEWKLDAEGSASLRKLQISDYEEVTCTTEATELFSDCTREAFDNHPVLRDQLTHGRDHWYGNLEATIGVEGRGNGIAIADVNNDGMDDIYFCQPAALPNRLFLRRRNGSLYDYSKEAGIDWLDSTRAALFVDLDNDGDQDLVLSHSTVIVIHENDGSGHFKVRRTIDTISRLFSINAVDLDNDRLLDLFVCGYSSAANSRPEDVFVSPVPYHDANNGGPNYLLHNDGNWQFTDITKSQGLDTNNLRFSLASTWDDFDNDGDLDLYVANDFGRNNLYRNEGGKFTDVASTAGVEDIGPGMSAVWNDSNNDGLVDLYVSNMFSSAGSRITHNTQFKPGVSQEDLAGFRRHARGNSLFLNQGDGKFHDQSVAAGVTMGRWAWGSSLVDLNNDGLRDIYVTNGFVTADNNNDL